MAGEQPATKLRRIPRSFQAKPRWQRLIIAFAGPGMNILLAVGLLTGLFMVRYPKLANPTIRATIGYITPGSPAEQAGLREGDTIVQIDRHPRSEMAGHPAEGSRQRRPRNIRRLPPQRPRLQTTVTPKLEERTGIGTVRLGRADPVLVGGRDARHGCRARRPSSRVTFS